MAYRRISPNPFLEKGEAAVLKSLILSIRYWQVVRQEKGWAAAFIVMGPLYG